MGTGYTRNDTSNNIADGNIINAADFDGEYDAIEAAFNSSTGHTHDGTSAEGAPITVLGPNQEFVASSSEVKPSTNAGLDIGTTTLKFKDLYLDGTAYIDGLGGDILTATDKKIQFRDTAIFINSSADGQLDIDADTTIELNSPEVIATDDFRLKSDAAILTFGADNDVTVTHVADTGLDAKAASGFALKLQTGDTTIESGNTLGKISFNAPDEASGTDAILVGAEIEAAAEDTFSSTVNSTALVFKTNTSAAATERMRIKSDGDIVLKGASYDFVFDASAHALTTSASNGDLNITPHGTGTVVITGDLDVDNINIDGNTISSTDTNGNINITPNGTGKVNITGGIMQDEVNLESTDAGTAAGPTMDVFRNSASPVDNDLLGNITFTGKDDGGNTTTYASIDSAIIDASDSTEDGQLQFKTMVAGSLDAVVTLKEGNVGIGTSSGLGGKLDISIGTDARGYFADTIGEVGSGNFALQVVNSAGSALKPLGFRAEDIRFAIGSSERMRIDTSGRLLLGHTSSIPVEGNEQKLQLVSSDADGGVTIARFNNNFGPYISFGRSGSGTIGSYTAVPVDDALGRIQWGVADGTDMTSIGASITAFTEQLAASNDVPSRLVFSTTADGASTPTERMRINSSGAVGIGCTPDSTISLDVQNLSASSNNVFLRIKNTTSLEDSGIIIDGNNGGQREYKIGVNTIVNSSDLTFSGGTGYQFIVGSTEAMRINSSQNVLVGSLGAAETTISGGSPNFQVTGSVFDSYGSFTRRQNTQYGGGLVLAKSRNSSANSYTIVQDDDILGSIIFIGDDGTDLDTYGANIAAEVDGTPGANDMPARLVFKTTADGAASPTEAMRINKDGFVGIGGATDPSYQLDVKKAGTTFARVIATTNNTRAGYLAQSHLSDGTDINMSIGVFGDANQGEISMATGHPLLLYTNNDPSKGVELQVDGDLNIKDGNLVLASTHGIDFSATTDGTSTQLSELLDDYEEGTFTYNLVGGTSGGWTSRTGYTTGTYIKIGRVVHVQIRYESTSRNSPQGNLQMTGLPFTSANHPTSGNGSHQMPVLLRGDSASNVAGHFISMGHLSTTVTFFQQEVAGTTIVAVDSNADTTGNIEGTINMCYRTQ